MKHLPFIGRVFLSALFLLSGYNKLMDYAGTVGYIESVGLPMAGTAAVIAIVVELGAGLMLLVGWQARLGAAALAIYTLLLAFLFHFDFSQQMQVAQFLKNLAIVGGLLFVVAHGAGCCGITKEKRTE